MFEKKGQPGAEVQKDVDTSKTNVDTSTIAVNQPAVELNELSMPDPLVAEEGRIIKADIPQHDGALDDPMIQYVGQMQVDRDWAARRSTKIIQLEKANLETLISKESSFSGKMGIFVRVAIDTAEVVTALRDLINKIPDNAAKTDSQLVGALLAVFKKEGFHNRDLQKQIINCLPRIGAEPEEVREFLAEQLRENHSIKITEQIEGVQQKLGLVA